MTSASQRAAWTFTGVVLGVAVLAGAALLGFARWHQEQWLIVVAMTAIGLVIQASAPKIPWTNEQVSPLVLTVITTAVLVGPTGAFLVGFFGVTRWQQVRTGKWRALLVNASGVGLSGAMAGLAFYAIVPRGVADLVSLAGFAGLALAIVAATVVNVGILSLYMGILHGSRVLQELDSLVGSVLTMMAGALVLSPIVLAVFGILGNAGLILLVLPVAILHLLLGQREQRARVFRRAVDGLGSALAAKDRGTYEHSRRVGVYASAIGERLRMSQAQVQLLYVNGLMHDVGKLGVDDRILLKPERFTVDEYQHMKSHATMSEAITRPVWSRIAGFNAVSYHHERWDGRGYPHGLAKDEIPLQGRILAVADSFDAMTADRPYHRGIPGVQAFEELIRCAGTQFDPEIVRAFLESQRVPVPADYEDRVRRQVACAAATGAVPGATATLPQLTN